MDVIVHKDVRRVTLATAHLLPEGVQGQPGFCEHTFDYAGLSVLINRLIDASLEIGPMSYKFKNPKVLDCKSGRY